MNHRNAKPVPLDPALIDAGKYPHFRRIVTLEAAGGLSSAIYRNSHGGQIEEEKAAFWAEHAPEPKPAPKDPLAASLADARARQLAAGLLTPGAEGE